MGHFDTPEYGYYVLELNDSDFSRILFDFAVEMGKKMTLKAIIDNYYTFFAISLATVVLPVPGFPVKTR